MGEDHGGSPAEAIRATLRENQPFLRALALRLCRNAEEAGDLVQDTCERALRHVHSGLPDAPRAWLATIMHNLFIDRCRARIRQPARESMEAALAAPALPQEPEPSWSRLTVEDVRDALAQLDPEFREVYRMQAFERRSYSDIAAALGIEPATVGTRLHRARKKLREILMQRAPGGTST